MADLRDRIDAVRATTRFSRLARERARFWIRVATRSRQLSRYRLPHADVVFHIRHGTVDILTLDEIFREGHYAFPAEVERALHDLGRPPRVADLGANVGLFGVYVRGLFPDAEIVAFEPHPANVEVLRRTIDANAGPAPWDLVAACATGNDGMVRLAIDDQFTTARVDPDAEATIDVPAVDVFPYLAASDLVKIDIEGGEWDLLADPRFSATGATAIVVECHPFRAPGPDVREAASTLLERAGYRVVAGAFVASEGHGVVWGWRPAAPD